MKEGFFEVQSVAKCMQILQEFHPITEIQDLDVGSAMGRVLARDALSDEDLPAFSRSSMDGYAVRARDCFGASEANPAYLTVKAALAVDEKPDCVLMPGECAQIYTGGTLPQGADAVVMAEYTRCIADDEIEIFKPLGPGDNVMLAGEDCGRGQVAVGAGTRLRPQELGILAALGHCRVHVFRPPRVAILSTGDELVPVHEKPPPGKVRDVNSTTLAAWCARAGAEPINVGIIQDSLPKLQEAIPRAVAESDLVLLSGGSSVGTRDFCIEAISSLPKGRIMVHGIALSPGKPTIVAAQGRVPIVGLPGQVTSAQVVMYVLGLPFLRHLGGQVHAFQDDGKARITARVSRNISSPQGREDYVRVKIVQDPETGVQAEPILAKSGLLRSLLQADGLLPIPAQSEGVMAGDAQEVWLF
ncbi:MAG: molybdopterin molybdotransferase MoeA [Desulfovermiculus sp.]